jgi:hypothetical protein
VICKCDRTKKGKGMRVMTNGENEEAKVLKSKVGCSFGKMKKVTGYFAAEMMLLTHIFLIVE